MGGTGGGGAFHLAHFFIASVILCFSAATTPAETSLRREKRLQARVSQEVTSTLSLFLGILSRYPSSAPFVLSLSACPHRACHAAAAWLHYNLMNRHIMMMAFSALAKSLRDSSTNHSPPMLFVCVFFEVEISLHTPIPLFLKARFSQQ